MFQLCDRRDCQIQALRAERRCSVEQDCNLGSRFIDIRCDAARGYGAYRHVVFHETVEYKRLTPPRKKAPPALTGVERQFNTVKPGSDGAFAPLPQLSKR